MVLHLLRQMYYDSRSNDRQSNDSRSKEAGSGMKPEKERVSGIIQPDTKSKKNGNQADASDFRSERKENDRNQQRCNSRIQ